MQRPAAALPPISKVAAALRKTTETLARELSLPSSHAPLWTEFEWRIARVASAIHGVSSLLCNRLRWEGPPGWRQFLLEQRDQSIARHQAIAGLLEAIDLHARGAGVALVALKGAALLAGDIYSAGERPMGDIDLLVRAVDTQANSRVLELCGYAAAFSSHRHDVFQPVNRKVIATCRLGEHLDNPINIEVHTRIAERLPVNPVDITGFLFPTAARRGLSPYPSAASLMMHLLLHAAGNMRARALRLIQLHDISLMASRFAFNDWEELAGMRPDGHGLWWAWAPLLLTTRYYPASFPPDLFARLRLESPWLLRTLAQHHRLTDVSWSNIRIAAFPGVEWSRSASEALAFMSGRIWPRRAALSELKEGAAQIPGSSSVPWYGIPHAARIWRWILFRPPRVQTLLSVRAALASSL
jgi:Uncharacterised nucleotidyltransferase